jgi:hypothetical protein
MILDAPPPSITGRSGYAADPAGEIASGTVPSLNGRSLSDKVITAGTDVDAINTWY